MTKMKTRTGTLIAAGLIALAALCFSARSSAGDWPQWLGERRDGVWRETGIVDRFPEDIVEAAQELAKY